MTEVQLDTRLGAMMELVGQALRVADIGADHGHLALALLQQCPARQVLISDISADSLEKARLLFQNLPEQERAVFVVADGLDALSAMPDIDAIAIAGMGAGLIKQMLDRGKERIGDAVLCLQPNRDIHFLRAWLQENSFIIEAERLVYAAGRYYSLLRAKQGHSIRFSEKELFLGPMLCKDKSPLFPGYLSWQRDVLRYTLAGLGQSTQRSAARKAKEIRRQLRWVEEELTGCVR